jgi:hypothetical protein
MIAPLLLLAALFPRGWTLCTLTLTTPAGVSRVVEHRQLIPPPWLRGLSALYPGWTTTTDTGTPPTNLDEGPGVVMLGSQQRLTWTGIDPASMMLGGSTTYKSATWGVLNGHVVSFSTAPRVAKSIATMLARGGGSGVQVTITTDPTAPQPAFDPE